MAHEDFELPASDERDILIAGLARVIAQRGAEHFLTAPLLYPDPRFFPDPIEPRGRGVGVMIRRLLAYADMAEMNVAIEIDQGLQSLESDDGEYHMREAAGWFHGIADGTCHFGVDDRELRDDEALIGTLGHEVAHAYRSFHDIVAIDRNVEEKLTDLTTVYLGFGVFTLISSWQFKTGHYDAQGQQLLYERRQRGYLSPGQLAFLLAAQLVARKTERSVLRAIENSLDADHVALLKQAQKELSRDRPKLLEELRLPPETEWPAERKLESVVVPLPIASLRVDDLAGRRSAREKTNKVAFRIRAHRGCAGFVVGLAAAFGVIMILKELGPSVWLIALGLVLVGVLAGKGMPGAICSGCQHHVGSKAARCSFCRLALVGDIADANDVFEAEDRYRRALGKSPKARKKRRLRQTAESA